jgi:glutamate 5-kinase
MSQSIEREVVGRARRVVVKLGTAVLVGEQGGVALDRLQAFAEAIAALRRSGRDVILVSSGAIGLGADRLRITRRPLTLPVKQACAAVGQGRLMALYADAFERLGLVAAQLLLTEDDFSNRTRYLNLRSTLTQLLELGAVPVINENDTVSTAELEVVGPDTHRRVNFGDNDKLSALVASKIEADLLVILTDVEGLYTADPRRGEARLIPLVERITPEVEALASPTGAGTRLGRGGMRTKLEAARVATRSGCATIVAGGHVDDVLGRLFRGEEVGTLFLPQPGLRGRRRWIAFATSVRAAVVVNEGACRALLENRASLLPAGIVDVKGSFDRGDVVSIVDAEGREIGRGIVNYSSAEVRRVSGQRSERLDELVENRNYDALITRDNIAFLEPIP